MIFTLLLSVIVSASPQAVILYGGDATLAGELSAQLGAEQWSVVAAAPIATMKPHPALAHFVAGKAAYDDLMFEEALPSLTSARDMFEQSTLQPEGWQAYLQTLLYLSLTYDGLGKAEQSDSVLDRFAFLSPDPALLNESFPPPFRKKVLERLQVQPPKTGALRVESLPPGATVYLNGRARGRTPMVIADLRGGEHTVSLSLAGYATSTKKVTIVAGFGIGAEATPDLVEMRLAPAINDSAAQALTLTGASRLPNPAGTATLQRALRDMNKTAAIFVVAGPVKTVVTLLPVKGAWRGPAIFDGDAVSIPPLRAQMESQLADWLPSLNRQPSVPGTTTQIQKETPSHWWLWTGLGILAAGGATAAVIASQTSEPQETTGDVVLGW